MKTIKHLKFIISLAIILIIIFTIILKNHMDSFKNDSNDKVEYLIGMSHPNLTDDLQITLHDEIKNEIKKHDNVRVIFTNAAQSTYKQIKDINLLMDYGIDLLIITVNDANVLNPVIKKINKKIPVIVLGKEISGSDYTLFIGPDNHSIGEKAGKRVKKILNGQRGNVVEIRGPIESPTDVEISRGFVDVLNKCNNINIVKSFFANWQRDQAEDKFKEFLKTNRDVDVVFAHNDAMAKGAKNATATMGVKNIKFIGVGGIQKENNGVELVCNGSFDSTYLYPLGGKEAVEYALSILNNKEIPKKIILRSQEVTKDNVKQFLNINNYKIKKNNSKITLGFVQAGINNSWLRANTNSILEAANFEGINIIFKDVPDGISIYEKQKQQKNIIRELIKKGVDVISFSPIVQNGWDEILKEVNDAKIPVILANKEVDTSDDLWLTYLGTDFFNEGRMAAKFLVENIYDGTKNINIAVIKGTNGSSATIDRMQGFNSVINGYSSINVKYRGTGNFNYEEGKLAMNKILQKSKGKIDVVFSQSDDMALGAVDAIKKYGLKPGKDIFIISIDGTSSAVQAVVRSEINCTVESNPLIGYQLMKTVKDAFTGKILPKKIINESKIISSKNAKTEVKLRRY